MNTEDVFRRWHKTMGDLKEEIQALQIQREEVRGCHQPHKCLVAKSSQEALGVAKSSQECLTWRGPVSSVVSLSLSLCAPALYVCEYPLLLCNCLCTIIGKRAN